MKIEKYSIDKDIRLVCVQATSFPPGVQAAFQKLHALVPDGSTRRNFGISRPEGGGGIVYKAAVEEKYDGEAKELSAEGFTVKKGEYNSILINDFMNDIQSIGRAFTELLAQPGIDPQGYCLEWYQQGKDVLCLVPLK